MKNYAVCPISDKKVNENIVRSNAFFTVLLLLTFVATNSLITILFLLFDFALRAFNLSQYSLLTQLSSVVVSKLGLTQNYTNAGPKLFAARIGLIFSFLILGSVILNSTGLANILAIVFGTFAFLEVSLGVCIACKIYPFFFYVLYKTRFSALG